MEKEKKNDLLTSSQFKVCYSQTLRHFVRVRAKASIKCIAYIIEGYYISGLLISYM